MASRLVLKCGLVPEQDRLETSPDAVLVSEPTTGSKARTKGSLYLIATSRTIGPRTHEACRLVADTVRREYYYDESAGIAIVLEKAIRSANRRLRHSREGSGQAPGSIGVAAAVVRGNELYVVTSGDPQAFLVRSARLLMPEHEPGVGLPAPDALRVDVWRGEFAVGDSLVLAASNVVDVVGTEELKNALVTLHPQSAVEHLHHLFVAAGGDGSDAIIAIEASEVALSRVEHRLVPVSPSEPLAGAPLRSPIPLADQVAGAASAVQGGAVAMRSMVRDSVSRAVGRLVELMPRRQTPYRRFAPSATRRETQRRAALAALAFLGVVAVVGAGLWWWSNQQMTENPRPQITEGEAAYAAATANVERVFGAQNLLLTDPPLARQLLQTAWTDLDRAAEVDVDADAIAEVREQIRPALDRLYGTHPIESRAIYSVPEGAEITALARGPDDAAYVIADRSVFRVDPDTGEATRIVQAGDGPAEGIGAPRLLGQGGADLLIVDVRGGLWRWRTSGTLDGMTVAGDATWGRDVADIQTFPTNPERGLYRMLVPHPPSRQILRYEQVADGSGFGAPTPYFVGEGENVTAFRQLAVDGDIYALLQADVARYFNGRRLTYTLDPTPDAEDLRPGVNLGRMAMTGGRGVGQLLVWDSVHSRVIAYAKNDASYIEQFVGSGVELSDLRGMYVIDRGEAEPPILIWASATTIYETVLEPTAEPEPTASPEPGATPRLTPAPGTPDPTDRPRRTPRETPAT